MVLALLGRIDILTGWHISLYSSCRFQPPVCTMKNKLSQRHKILLDLALISLLFGFLNYMFFESHISFFMAMHIQSGKTFFIQNSVLRNFMKGYFSDIAWCCSLYLVTVVFSERNSLDIVGKILILLLPFLVEFAQYFDFIHGTFDWFDLLTYLIIMILFIIFFPTLIAKKNENT